MTGTLARIILVALLISPFRVPRPRLIEYVTNIKNSPSVDIVHIDSELDARGWDLLSKREDKDWSLVDCTSFVLMKDQRIESSLTSDHHFEQVGFVRLLK